MLFETPFQLSDDMELVGEAGSGRAALVRCQESLPDVILMDIVEHR